MSNKRKEASTENLKSKKFKCRNIADYFFKNQRNLGDSDNINSNEDNKYVQGTSYQIDHTMRPTDLGSNLSSESIQNKSCDFSVRPIQINDDAVNPNSTFESFMEKDIDNRNSTQTSTKTYSDDYQNLQMCLDEDDERSSVNVSEKTSAPNLVLDIGNYIGFKIDDLTKKGILQNHWVPPKNYQFPYSMQMKNGVEGKRYASQKHLDQYKWLVLSEAKKGYFCKYCALFLNVGGNHKNVHVKKLVSEPLCKFTKLFGKDGFLDNHASRDYHIQSLMSAKQFLKFIENPNLDIVNQVHNERLKQVLENRKRLRPIVECINYLGRQGISFRGHRDDGQLNINTVASPINEGNFRELLKFRIQSGDLELKNHLEQSSARATFISKTSQNELINSFGEEILDVIISRIKEANFYSIIFDETTDIAHISQMTLVARYLYKGKVREDFIKFIDLYNEIKNSNKTDCEAENEIKETGYNLAQVVLETLKKSTLEVKNCVGVTTDGCSVMVSETVGAVVTFKNEAINAVYSPCFNHILNLSIGKSSSVQSVRNAIGTMKQVISFFKTSAKRNIALKNMMGHQLSGLCETRWVERHNGVLQFRESLPKIHECLDAVSSWSDSQTSAKAKILISATSEPEFLVTTICLSEVLSHTLPLSRFFQRPKIDLKSARDMLNDVLKILNRKREKCNEIFSSLYDEICGIADELSIEIKLPRLAKKQRNRENYPCENPQDYFKRSIYIPILDNVIEDLQSRFPEETLNLYSFSILFPELLEKSDEESIANAAHILADKYCVFFNESSASVYKTLRAELEYWEAYWKREKYDLSYDSVKLLEFCDIDIYPKIHTFLKIFATLPLSASSAERTFSTLRRLKTWLRSTMVEERLVGLALMNIHHDIHINIDKVIDRYAHTRTHRLDFVL
ncbi:52 kDa repressor of the inhibitor of the protein kinase-like [Diabrotica virgifera virgifera]|uniref:52 kDa repressor of the inhibitor of the protein kinase-like n=1 Tax=Diabrotica virgifera virgifera TaxID=50390 RepID=A0ABM5KSY5_DIAVI|nr:52 kDa repressor of the inhibitor of the protein kinase-like [Diabrotica virgifera virgifera]